MEASDFALILISGQQGVTTQAPVLVALANLSVAVLSLSLAYVRNKQPKRRLEAWIKQTGYLPFNPRVMGTELRIGDRSIAEPSYTVVRLLNAGQEAIPKTDFESPLTISLPSETQIISVRAASRPSDVVKSPKIDISGRNVHLSPLLLNATDLVELHILADGRPMPIAISGRIRDLPAVKVRRSPPYPPGVGPEGEMIHLFERVMMYGGSAFVGTATGAALPYLLLFDRSYASTTAYIGSTIFLGLVGAMAAVWRVQVLKRRRALWVPAESA